MDDGWPALAGPGIGLCGRLQPELPPEFAAGFDPFEVLETEFEPGLPAIFVIL